MKAEEIPQQIRIVRKSVKEVYQEFCENGRKDRAYRTKQKQDISQIAVILSAEVRKHS